MHTYEISLQIRWWWKISSVDIVERHRMDSNRFTECFQSTGYKNQLDVAIQYTQTHSMRVIVFIVTLRFNQMCHKQIQYWLRSRSQNSECPQLSAHSNHPSDIFQWLNRDYRWSDCTKIGMNLCVCVCVWGACIAKNPETMATNP